MNVTPAEFARHLGKSRQYVNKLIRSGRVVVSFGRIDLEKSLTAIGAQRDPAHDLRVENPQESSSLTSLGYYEARAVREQIQAKLLLLELKKREGKLIDADQILLAHQKVWSTLRSNLRGLPRKLAGRMAAAKKEVECERLMAEGIDAELKRTAEKPFSLKRKRGRKDA
jgi:hypothetical protein